MKKVWKIVAVLLLALIPTTVAAVAAQQTAGAEQMTFAEQLTAFASAHLPELLSALTLLGTGCLAWIFKRSVLPILEHGLGKIGGGVQSLSEDAKKILEQARAEAARLAESARTLQASAEAETARAAMLEQEMAQLREKAETERRELRALTESSIAMMKEVFTAARLPAASKLALEEIYRSAHEPSKVSGENS